MIRAYLRQHHVGLVALLLVVLSGGSAYAAATIGAADIKKDAVRSKHIKANNVIGTDANEATFDVSRVVNRARGTNDVDLNTTPGSYVLQQGASWTQAANESVTGFVGEVIYDNQSCVGAGMPTLILTVNVDNQAFGSIGISTSGAPGQTTKSFRTDVIGPLFEPGAPTGRTFAVEVSHSSCSVSGGPVRLFEASVNLVAVR